MEAINIKDIVKNLRNVRATQEEIAAMADVIKAPVADITV